MSRLMDVSVFLLVEERSGRKRKYGGSSSLCLSFEDGIEKREGDVRVSLEDEGTRENIQSTAAHPVYIGKNFEIIETEESQEDSPEASDDGLPVIDSVGSVMDVEAIDNTSQEIPCFNVDSMESYSEDMGTYEGEDFVKVKVREEEEDEEEEDEEETGNDDAIRFYNEDTKAFECRRCSRQFPQGANLVNHLKICNGEEFNGVSKKCRFCGKWIINRNFPRHKRICGEKQKSQTPSRNSTSPIYAGSNSEKTLTCRTCGIETLSRNMTRHLKTCLKAKVKVQAGIDARLPTQGYGLQFDGKTLKENAKMQER